MSAVTSVSRRAEEGSWEETVCRRARHMEARADDLGEERTGGGGVRGVLVVC